MKVQQDFVNALQREEDPRYRFRVDRWTRKEGGGGVTCILQVCLLPDTHFCRMKQATDPRQKSFSFIFDYS